MDFAFERQESYVLACVAGSLDSSTAAEFHVLAQPLVEQCDSDLFLDMSATDYLSSDGLGGILKLHKAAKKKSKQLVIISPAPLVREVLHAARFDAFVPIVDDVDGAIAITRSS